MDNQDILNQIQKEITGAGAQTAPNQKFIECPECSRVSSWMPNMPIPSKCGFCGKADLKFIVSSTYEEAVAKSQERLKAKSNATQPSTAEPKTTQVPIESTLQKPAPVVEAPKVQRRRVSNKPAQTTVPMSATIPEQNLYSTSPAPSMVSVSPTDARERRRKAVDLLAAKFDLNHDQMKPVGKANVYALGFTEWTINELGKKVPAYEFSLPTDDKEYFSKLYREARKRDSMISMDAVMLNNIEPDELCDCLFNGQLIATTNSRKGPVLAMVGAKVEVGAKLSDNGNLIFGIIRVI